MSRDVDLILHCGAAAVEREQVEQSATPAKTETWHPIPHRSLVDMLRLRLPQYGMNIVKEAHALTKEGLRYFGLFQVAVDAVNEDDEDFGLVFGLRNSHDKTFPAGLCLGSSVFVCDNLSFSSEIVIGRRHTKNIMVDLPRLMSDAVGKMAEARVHQANRLEAYKQTELTDTEAKALILDAFTAKAINTTRIPKVLEQWQTPAHPEFAEKTAWRLFNGFTEVYKNSSLAELPNRSTRLHGLLDSACGIVVDAASVRENLRADNEENEDVEIN